LDASNVFVFGNQTRKRTADGYQNFAGPTQLCEVVRQEIMGNRNKNDDTYRRGRPR